MKIKMKVGMSGTLNGVPWPPQGGVADVPDVVGAKLCASGLADPVAEEKKVEKAVALEPEKRAEVAKPAAKPAESKSAGRRAK
jgi:hypothetical protein